jgi:hypothetical protein
MSGYESLRAYIAGPMLAGVLITPVSFFGSGFISAAQIRRIRLLTERLG